MYSVIVHGKKLGKCGFAVKLWRNSFSAATISSQEDGKIFSVSYLVTSLGLTPKEAESISRKVNSGNPDSVLSLLTRYGFTDSQISNIITDYPQLLIADAEESLAPKLKFLHSRGASTSELTVILSKVPKILRMKKDKAVSRYYDIVKEIIEADKSSNSKKLCHSLPKGSHQENRIRNVLVLRDMGVPQEMLFSFLFSNCQPVCGKDKFEESLNKVLEMGFDPTTSRFARALNAVYGMSDKTIDDKIDVYTRLGFAVGDVWAMFKKHPNFLRMSENNILNSCETFLGLGFSSDELVLIVKRYPTCLLLSTETVKKKTEFLLKTMNWPIKALVTNPVVLGCSMEKRIVPRCSVIKALVSKGLRQLPSTSLVFSTSDESFLNKFVRKHHDKELVAELMSIFTGGFVS